MSQQTEDAQRTLRGLEPDDEIEPVADAPAAASEEEPGRIVEEDEDADGVSRTRSATAPASAGKPTGDQGEVEPEGSPDLRPRDAGGAREPTDEDETPVPDPSVSDASRTGSAGAASSMAGSAGAEREPEANPRRGEAEMDEEKPEDWGE